MIPSAATDPFAAIFAGPGAAAPGGDAGVASGGAFGTLMTGTSAAPTAVPSFRGTLTAATLPVGALVSAATPAPAVATPAVPVNVVPAASLPPAIARTMPAPAPATLMRSAALVAAMPAAWPPAPGVVPAPSAPGAPTDTGRATPVVAAPLPEMVMPAGPDGAAPGPASSAMTPGAVDATVTPSDPAMRIAPALAPAIPAPAGPTPAVPLAPIQRASLPAAAPLGAVEDAARPPLVAAPLPDLVQPVAPEMEPVMVEPVATAPAVIALPDRHGPVPIGKGDASIAAKPAAPHKPVIASAPTPVVFATAAQSAPAAPEATKDAATPVDQASPEDAAPADPERNDPATVALPTMAPVPVLAQVVTPPPSGSDGPAKSASTEGQAPAHGTPAVTAAVPGAAPPVAPTTPGKADVAASPDRPAVVTATGLRPVREETTSTDPKPATASAPDPRGFAALVEPKPVAAPPAATPAAAQPSPVPEARVAAEPGRMGHEMAVAIARHTAEGGGEALTVRLNPAEFGRIDVTLSFDDRGTLRAVLAAETPAALDVLRRDSADLGRALSDAGMRTDAQSFRFDTRQGGADAGGQGAPGQQRWQPAATPRHLSATVADALPEPEYRPLRTRGGVDLMA
jgi:hypothetical protein